MTLAAGTRIGPYHIVELLGAGGMGEVYRAQDTKLNREVAIKVLQTSLANDPERIARLGREAQMLASLNHPNIAHIHGVEDSAGLLALVMELVEGPTLADRIGGRPMPVDEAMAIAKQIAEALETAHEQGIIHRDLKPANIKVRADGTVKLLDFGLAKALVPTAATTSNAADSPTLSMQATAAGVILGTAAYMAPEQARGQAADRRADIWAFGCVLYEMLAGCRAFRGDDLTDTIVAVLSKAPDWNALPASAADVRTLLARCLRKERQQRLQAIGDARIQIEELISGTGEAATAAHPGVRVRWRRSIATAIAALAGGAIVALGTWALTRPAPPASSALARFAIMLPPAQPLANSFNARDLALSSDGTHMVYSGGAQAQLMVRALDQLDARPLPGITNARTPFLSTDGHWIGFFDLRGDLKKVSISGGAPVAVCRVNGTSRGASWGVDDTIVFATSDRSTGIFRVPAAGGEPAMLTTVDTANGELDHYFPSVLPDDRGVLYTIELGNSGTNIAVFDPTTGRSKTLIQGGAQAEYVETGHLIYMVASTLWAVPFDLAKLETNGEPVPVLEPVMPVRGDNGGNFSVSRRGTLVYAPQRGNFNRSLVWVSRSGIEEPVGTPARVYAQPRLSPDGSRVAITIADHGSTDIFTLDLVRGTQTRLTFNPGGNTYPVWTPDGQHIVFASNRGASLNLFRRAADGTGADERLTTSGNGQRPTTMSPDGARVVFEENSPNTAWDLWSLPLNGKRQATALVPTQFDERNPDISPDGRWLAFESNESGQTQVYVRSFPNVDGAIYQISTDGGRSPVWARNGDELFFANGTTLLSVAVKLSGSFTHGNPTKLFEGRSLLFDARLHGSTGGAYRMYDVSPDGRRFLMVKEIADGQSGTQPGMVVVLNWFDELKSKVSSR
jgi:serine/threonine-protein kinase